MLKQKENCFLVILHSCNLRLMICVSTSYLSKFGNTPKSLGLAVSALFLRYLNLQVYLTWSNVLVIGGSPIAIMRKGFT